MKKLDRSVASYIHELKFVVLLTSMVVSTWCFHVHHGERRDHLSAGSDCAFCMGPPEEVFNLPPNAEREEAKPHTRAWHWENALISLRSSWVSSWDSCCPARPGNRAHKGQQLAGM